MKKSIANEAEFGVYEAVVIGTSSGGMDALATLLSLLSDTFPLPLKRLECYLTR